MGGAHNSENQWTLGFQGIGMATPAQVNAVLVGPQRGGQTTSSESLGAAGNKRPRTVDFGTPYERPMSSSGLQLIEVMMKSLSTKLVLLLTSPQSTGGHRCHNDQKCRKYSTGADVCAVHRS
ncbi:jg17405 [Pararge aegeria aegeria]|uniref:Jg17405 protein n=1 Tax=Pararge aegeria aegeria TaxID=348720 RepID=A0A8S4QNN7_9NEOP|nr:jg17405 [Pararge aegeria aegeria]